MFHKMAIIEQSIEPLLDKSARTPALRSRLKSMSVEQLKKLANEIADCTPKEALALVVAFSDDNPELE